ncbi:hypothetical protein CHU98_g5699 [Xylaria longipes]|nr:hypothetical protein CHU98_g5699 [Xylaria longipes]
MICRMGVTYGCEATRFIPKTRSVGVDALKTWICWACDVELQAIQSCESGLERGREARGWKSCVRGQWARREKGRKCGPEEEEEGEEEEEKVLGRSGIGKERRTSIIIGYAADQVHVGREGNATVAQVAGTLNAGIHLQQPGPGMAAICRVMGLKSSNQSMKTPARAAAASALPTYPIVFNPSL